MVEDIKSYKAVKYVDGDFKLVDDHPLRALEKDEVLI